MTEYQALANAIVVQAADDYRDARRKLLKDPENKKALKTVDEVERFFRSPWFGSLTTLDGHKILERLKEEFDA